MKLGMFARPNGFDAGHSVIMQRPCLGLSSQASAVELLRV